MKNITDIKSFAQELQSLWNIENMLTAKMPSMMQKANNFGLKKSLAYHFAETRQHRVIIQLIYKQIDLDLRNDEIDDQLQSIFQEGERSMDGQNGTDLDAAIIRIAQEVERYEISLYNSAAEKAKKLGYDAVAARLRLTLEEEKQAATKLKFIEGVLLKETAEIGQSIAQYH